MGMNAILNVILSFLVVGLAIVIGVYMFWVQADKQAEAAMVQDIQLMLAQAQAWYITPRMMGGAEGQLNVEEDTWRIIHYIDPDTGDLTSGFIMNHNGRYDLAFDVNEDDKDILVITGTSKNITPIRVRGSINLGEGASGIKIDLNPIVIN
jgi:hypothetical protein